MSKYWLPTYTGLRFDLLEPSIEMITIEDMAHHLSIENRFCGATKFAYSVGYHSVLCCYKAPEHLKLETLLHDGEETWYKDFPYWWKIAIREELGTNLWQRTILWTKGLIDTKFYLKFDEESHKVIKEIDLRMAETEKIQLVKNPAV